MCGVLQTPCRNSCSFHGITFGKLSLLQPYGFFGKGGVPNYTKLNKFMFWIRLRPSRNYWYIWLKVIMIVVRIMAIQLSGKEGEFKEFGHLFLLCQMHVMMLSGTIFHLIDCSLHQHRSQCEQYDLRWRRWWRHIRMVY